VEAARYLARAAVLAPDQAARFQQELAASSAFAATISPSTTSTSSGTGPTSDSAATTTLSATSTSIG
jgi:hypothetical protein